MELGVVAIAFVIAITIHEFAHAFTADRLGDPTPRVQGRLSLNPLAHIDMIGTVLVPLFLILSRSPIVFGWAKPVQFDPYNLENPRRDAAIISFAGPASNLLLAAVTAIIIHASSFSGFHPALVTAIAYPIALINVVLAVFNLIPIHPLDGGKILVGLLPPDIAYDWDRILRQYGLILLLLLIFPLFGGRALLGQLILPVIGLILQLFGLAIPVI